MNSSPSLLEVSFELWLVRDGHALAIPSPRESASRVYKVYPELLKWGLDGRCCLGCRLRASLLFSRVMGSTRRRVAC